MKEMVTCGTRAKQTSLAWEYHKMVVALVISPL